MAGSQPDPKDLDALHGLLRGYGEVLSDAVTIVRARTGLAPTARVKNTGTILEKLDRYGGSWLKSIQDLAGMRIVGDFDRNRQDDMVTELVRVFEDAPRKPKVVDRRVEPVQGYRAVHVIVFPDSVPVEIQVRTRLQHEWAEIFEKLADRVGRGIRYGEAPAQWLSAAERAELESTSREIYDVTYALRESVVRSALIIAEMVDILERADQHAPDDPRLPGYRQDVVEAIAQLRRDVDGLM